MDRGLSDLADQLASGLIARRQFLRHAAIITGGTAAGLGVSVACAALRREPTGAPTGFRSDVVATAKRKLKQGEVLDGEGGFCVWGKQTPADRSLEAGFLPLGLAHNVKLTRDVAAGDRLKWSDVAYDASDVAVKVRREMEAAFGRPNVGE